MTKIEKVVEAVRAAATVTVSADDALEAIEVILNECTKAELHKVSLAIRGMDAKKVIDRWEKEKIVRYYGDLLWEHCKEEAFQALSFDEKYEYIVSASTSELDRCTVICSLSKEEYEELAVRLGVSLLSQNVSMDLHRAIREQQEASKMELQTFDVETEAIAEVEPEVDASTEATAEVEAEATAEVEEVADVALEATPIKEENTMTKVERIVEAVKVAETQDAIETLLSECTKAELHKVLLAVCGEKARKAPNRWNNAEIVHSYAGRIQNHREKEAFRVLSFKEKYEYLRKAVRSRTGVLSVLFTLTWNEVQKLCECIGADPNVDREYLPMEIISKLSHNPSSKALRDAI